MDKKELNKIAQELVKDSKGILAADESTTTIKKRFDSINLENNEENRRAYRELLFTAPGIEEFISGVIMFEETMYQKDFHEVSFPDVLTNRGIMPGIKLDQGKEPSSNSPEETVTKGLEVLKQKAEEFKRLGAKFAKWRAAFKIDMQKNYPSDEVIEENARRLAEYAIICQEVGVVPIVEPEVLMDGTHDLRTAERVTYKVLKVVFNHLSERAVYLEGMLLKPNWVHTGYQAEELASKKDVAMATLTVLKEVVPPEVPGIVFLSGGDTPEASTEHLDLMNELKAKMDGMPWKLSFSFGRALQAPVLKAWQGKSENWDEAQEVFYQRAKLNSLATTGDYEDRMEEKEVD